MTNRIPVYVKDTDDEIALILIAEAHNALLEQTYRLEYDTHDDELSYWEFHIVFKDPPDHPRRTALLLQLMRYQCRNYTV